MKRKNNKILIFFLSLFCFYTTLSARVVLQDSSVINGKIIEKTDSTVIIENDYLGTIVVSRRYMLDRYFESTSDSGTTGSPGDGETGFYRYANEPNTNLVFVPTARTSPKGVLDFKDFELIFLTLSASVTNTTVLSTGILFPLTSDLQLYSLAVKQQVYSIPSGVFSAAVMGQISMPLGMDEIKYFWNTFAICSFQPSAQFSLHGSVLFSGGEREEWGPEEGISMGPYYESEPKNVSYTSFNFMIGAEVVTGKHTKFIVEYFDNLGMLDALDDNDGDLYFLNFAFRLFWPSISVDVAGVRPIASGEDFGSLLLLPFVNVSYRFGGK